MLPCPWIAVNSSFVYMYFTKVQAILHWILHEYGIWLVIIVENVFLFCKVKHPLQTTNYIFYEAWVLPSRNILILSWKWGYNDNYSFTPDFHLYHGPMSTGSFSLCLCIAMFVSFSLFLVVVSAFLWSVHLLSLSLTVFLSSSLTCSISRICHNRSGVNVNFLIYIISSLHNLTLTDRQTDSFILVCCSHRLANGVWTVINSNRIHYRTGRQVWSSKRRWWHKTPDHW